MEPGFVFLDEVLRGVRWDAKYATWDNFTGTPVDGYEVNRVVGSDAMASCLIVISFHEIGQRLRFPRAGSRS